MLAALLPQSVHSLVTSCNEHGGLQVLHQASSTGGPTSVAEFYDFCRSRLGLSTRMTDSVLTLLDTSNGIVKISKLISVLKVMAATMQGPPAAERDASLAAALSDEADPGASALVLETLAEILDTSTSALIADLGRADVDVTSPEAMAAFQESLRALTKLDLYEIRLPKGQNAPLVTAQHRGQALGYKVPAWSMRAVRQSMQRKGRPHGWGGAQSACMRHASSVPSRPGVRRRFSCSPFHDQCV